MAGDLLEELSKLSHADKTVVKGYCNEYLSNLQVLIASPLPTAAWLLYLQAPTMDFAVQAHCEHTDLPISPKYSSLQYFCYDSIRQESCALALSLRS